MAGFHYQLFLIGVSCIKTFEKARHCHCERSEAISKHVDNPQDCHLNYFLDYGYKDGYDGQKI